MTAEDVLLAERHRDRFGRLQSNSADLAVRAWDSLGDWTSPGAADVWAELWLPIDDAAVEAVALSTDAYFSMVAGAEPVGLEGLTGAEMRGVPAEEYARRPLVTVYTELGKGAWWADAVKAGRDRVAAMSSMDASLAQRRTADEWAKSGRVVGYRRTLTGSSCVLCAMASTQRYNRDNLAPLHTFCDCGMAPIVGHDDPGQVINEQLLEDLKVSGAAGDLSLQQGATRARKRARENRDRAEHYRALAADAETAAGKRRFDRRAANFRARAAAQDKRAAEFKAAREGGVKFKVEDHPELGPVIVRS